MMCIRALQYAVVFAIAFAPISPLPAAGQPQVAADKTSAPIQGYVLGPEDVIEISILGQPDFNVRAPVAADGTIQLPYIGKVEAANKTTNQLGADIVSALEAGGYYSHPNLSVQIVGFSSRYVTVLGQVGAPGLVPIDRAYHLSDILARVGGVKDDAADFLVVRAADGVEHRYLISSLATGGASDDPLVSPGDKIFSPKAPLFYISGQVRAPGAYPASDGLTLRMAIGRGGGLTDLGTDRAVTVRDAGGKVLRLGLDQQIQAGDVIVVGERLF